MIRFQSFEEVVEFARGDQMLKMYARLGAQAPPVPERLPLGKRLPPASRWAKISPPPGSVPFVVNELRAGRELVKTQKRDAFRQKRARYRQARRERKEAPIERAKNGQAALKKAIEAGETKALKYGLIGTSGGLATGGIIAVHRELARRRAAAKRR
jgi:hypothetical protein